MEDNNPSIGTHTCRACGRRFPLSFESRYTARNDDGLFLREHEPALWDAFDCPYCGCQSIIGSRKRRNDVEIRRGDGDE